MATIFLIERRDITLASIDKYTHEAICAQSAHLERAHKNPSNKDIDPSRTHLNYSFPMEHKNLSPFAYYKKNLSQKYLYGRGSQREKNAITGCGWVITLPKELYGNPEKEKAFFQGVFDFISERYGKENIINNAVHYDEKKMPHIHVLFTPVTKLDHEVVKNKTKRTSSVVRLDSGRYEFSYRFLLDENGKKIKLKNYAKATDLFDEKVDANTVLNKVELQNFHPDLQAYLIQNGIEGKIITGKTGTNFTVKELKEFTKATGYTLDEVMEISQGKDILESFMLQHEKIQDLEQLIADKDIKIESLEAELSQSKEQIRELEATKNIERTSSWSNPHSSWGNQSRTWSNATVTNDQTTINMED